MHVNLLPQKSYAIKLNSPFCEMGIDCVGVAGPCYNLGAAISNQHQETLHDECKSSQPFAAARPNHLHDPSRLWDK